MDKTYNVALCSYLASRYQKQSKLSKIVKDHQIGIPDHKCLKSYIEQRKTISPKIEGRIIIDYEKIDNGNGRVCVINNFALIIASLNAIFLFLKHI